MPNNNFPIKDAAEILLDAGLLSEVFVIEKGQVVSCPLHDVAALAGNFLGAGLDSRHLHPGELFVALAGENVDGRKFIPQVLQGGHWVLAAPGDTIATGLAAVTESFSGCGIILSDDPEASLAVLGSAWRQRQSLKVVGITGTNGKTTTKDLLATMLGARGATLSTQGNFNNHLGLPLTLLNMRPEHEFAVVEMGASAVGEIGFLAGVASPDIGIITNASEAHLAEFGSLAGIIQGKGELLDNLPEGGLAILNAESPGFEQWKSRASCPVSSFGRQVGGCRWSYEPAKLSQAIVTVAGTPFPVPLPGEHNAVNLVAALLAARHLGLGDEEIIHGLDSFKGSAHRGVLLSLGGRQILDDCYNANPRSMLAAVDTLLQQCHACEKVAVLGHMAEMGSDTAAIHEEIGRKLAAMGLKTLVAVGEDARGLLVGFDGAGTTGHYCSTLAEAADYLAACTTSGDCILIKGSRSAAMENILPLLKEKLDRK